LILMTSSSKKNAGITPIFNHYGLMKITVKEQRSFSGTLHPRKC